MALNAKGSQLRLIATALATLVVVLLLMLWSRGGRARSVTPTAPKAQAAEEASAGELPGDPDQLFSGTESKEAPVGRADIPQANGSSPQVNRPRGSEAERIICNVSGTVVNSSGRLLAGVRVTSDAIQSEVLSNALGTFETQVTLAANKRSGSFKLRLNLKGYAELTLKPRIAGSTLDLGELLMTASGSVMGRVLDEAGAGFDGAEVLVTVVQPTEFLALDQRPQPVLASTKSGVDGYFQLDDVPVGDIRLWAGAEGMLWAYQDDLVILAGGETRAEQLSLLPLDDGSAIKMVVLDPEGNPAVGARIHYQYRSDSSSGSGSHYSDANGAHRHRTTPAVAHDFSAADKDRRYRPAIVRNVEPGTMDLVLQLGEPVEFLLLVQDETGRDLPEFSVRPHTILDGKTMGSSSSRRRPEDEDPGRLSIQLPTEPFELTVDAPGHQRVLEGPFDPGQVGASLTIKLQRLAGVSGMVQDELGRPITGARVSLHALVDKDSSVAVNGFDCISERSFAATTSSDAEGRFELTLRKAGNYLVRASKDGLAPTEIGTIEMAPTVATGNLVLIMGSGGVIKGRVLHADSSVAAGQVVGVSRGDGFGFTMRADDAGNFRFEHLTPGEWLVEGRDAELSMNSTVSSSNSKPQEPIEWSCEVWAGRTTNFDLDLR